MRALPSPPPALISFDAARHEVGLDRLAVNFLDQWNDAGHRLGDNARNLGIGVFVTGLQAIAVHNGKPAEAAHFDGQPWIDCSIHGRSKKRNVERERTDRERYLCVFRVNGNQSRSERQFIETIRAARFAFSTDQQNVTFSTCGATLLNSTIRTVRYDATRTGHPIDRRKRELWCEA